MRPWNYYNEHDKFAAAWLRMLMVEGHIAPGDVDERSIEDVTPNDLRNYTQCHFFAGIGGWSHALRLAGWPDDRPVWTGSCPCQPFSQAGARGGTDDPRHLWPHWRYLVDQCRPSNIFGEQVASKDGRGWFAGVRVDLETMGYRVGAADLCSAGEGAPNIRQRLYWMADAGHEHTGRTTGTGETDGGTLRLGDSEGSARSVSIRQGGQQNPESGGSSDVSRLGEPSRTGLERRYGREVRDERAAIERTGGLSDGTARGMGNPASGGLGIDGSAPRSSGHPDEPIASQRGVGGMANATHADGWTGEHGTQAGIGPDDEWRRGSSVSGDARNFWRDYDVIQCTDGKARRVEPGTFPLAHGVPARVGRLRGYGNAINPEVAATFVEAYQEITEG